MAKLEKRIPIILFFIFASAFLFAQSTIKNSKTSIRFQLWYSLDSFPGLIAPETPNDYSITTKPTSNATPFKQGTDYSISKIKELLPFILEAQLYGWEFSYTPSDNARHVAEYFEITPIQTISINDPNISYDSPQIINEGKDFSCWITYTCTTYQTQLLQSYSAINFTKIGGKGSAPIQDETNAIKEAFSAAAKEAVRSYYRTIFKNKPKEITGTLYLIDAPRYYVVEGKYVADLDFFLKKGTIIQYILF